MNDTELVSEEQVKQDNKVKGSRISHNKWLRQEDVRAINKLPNEFREAEKNYNPGCFYHEDSFCGLYANE